MTDLTALLQPVARAAYRRGLVPKGSESTIEFVARAVHHLHDPSVHEIACLVALGDELRARGHYPYSDVGIGEFISTALRSHHDRQFPLLGPLLEPNPLFERKNDKEFSAFYDERLPAANRLGGKTALAVAGGVVVAILALLL